MPGDILTKVDRASMAHSLEVRVPFLDHNYVTWTAGVPTNDKLRPGSGKHVLKKALEPLLPHEVLYRSKMGFAVPLDASASDRDDASLSGVAMARALNKLAEFLCRIQVRSEAHPELDGAWFRAFDFEKWEHWGSSADIGWGAWSIESGWTQGWITAVLALRHRAHR